jgi:hypothetical protein
VKVRITFGQEHRHEVDGLVFDKDSIAVVHVRDFKHARKAAFELFGPKFFTAYTEGPDGLRPWKPDDIRWFPRGEIEVPGYSEAELAAFLAAEGEQQ